MTQSPLGQPQPPRPFTVRSGSPGQLQGAEPPLKDVLVELWQNIEKLVRQELALASAQRVLTELGLAHVNVLVAEQGRPGPSLAV